MGEVDTGVFKHMREQIKGGFDEERYASRIGFASLKRWVLRLINAHSILSDEGYTVGMCFRANGSAGLSR